MSDGSGPSPSRPSPSDEVRVTVGGPEPLVVDLVPAGAPGPARRAMVDARPPDADDRAAGRIRLSVTVDGWTFDVTVEPAARARLRERARRAAEEARPHARAMLRAQIPGRVLRVWVAAGETVEAGQRLLSIEAMKMENEIRAPRPGTVESVAVTAGQTVELGQDLVAIG